MRARQNIFKSFANAFTGMATFFLQERNGKVQLAVAVLVCLASAFFKISLLEWMMIVLCIGFVIAAEMINTALEKLCDLVHPDIHPTIKIVKDVSAAAVLWLAIVSAIIGLIIFIPHIVKFLQPLVVS